MKRVSFKVAKALKEAGYPQYGHCDEYYDSRGKVVDKMCDMSKLVFPCPTYLEVWPWLWEKEICIAIKNNHYYTVAKVGNRRFDGYTPEEVIAKAIEYLVDNKLLK